LTSSTVVTEALSQTRDTTRQIEAAVDVFRRLEQINCCCGNEDSDYVESIAALTYSTSLTLNGFRDRLLKHERTWLCPLLDEAIAGDRAISSAEQEVKSLKYYLMGQSISISSILRKWQS